MTDGPYRQGRNAVSASTLNETHELARRPFRFGADFSVTQTGLHQLVNLRQVKQPAVAVAAGIRYGYVLGVVESKPEKVRVQFIKSRIEIFGNVERELWSDDGESLIVSVPPQFLATDYNKLKATSLVSTTPILRFDKQGGKWRGTLEPRWAYKDRPPLGRLVRCST